MPFASLPIRPLTKAKAAQSLPAFFVARNDLAVSTHTRDAAAVYTRRPPAAAGNPPPPRHDKLPHRAWKLRHTVHAAEEHHVASKPCRDSRMLQPR